MSKANNTSRPTTLDDPRPLVDSELDAVSGSGAFMANASHTSMSEAAEALKTLAQK
jgi:hypothetical protein